MGRREDYDLRITILDLRFKALANACLVKCLTCLLFCSCFDQYQSMVKEGELWFTNYDLNCAGYCPVKKTFGETINFGGRGWFVLLSLFSPWYNLSVWSKEYWILFICWLILGSLVLMKLTSLSWFLRYALLLRIFVLVDHTRQLLFFICPKY